jgi:hypothetical protein
MENSKPSQLCSAVKACGGGGGGRTRFLNLARLEELFNLVDQLGSDLFCVRRG